VHNISQSCTGSEYKKFPAFQLSIKVNKIHALFRTQGLSNSDVLRCTAFFFDVIRVFEPPYSLSVLTAESATQSNRAINNGWDLNLPPVEWTSNKIVRILYSDYMCKITISNSLFLCTTYYFLYRNNKNQVT